MMNYGNQPRSCDIMHNPARRSVIATSNKTLQSKAGAFVLTATQAEPTPSEVKNYFKERLNFFGFCQQPQTRAIITNLFSTK